jgi:ABC-type nitrate/sulfonate/bicarbonate transport system permease component
MEKPIWQSKKFVLALTAVIMDFLVAMVPSVATLDPETLDALQTLLVWIIPVFLTVIFGHGLQDFVTASKGWQAPPREVNLEAMPKGE